MQSLLRARPELVKAVDNESRNALYCAASSADHKMVAAYAMNRSGYSPLHGAALLGHTDTIREILWHCPDSVVLSDLTGQNALHLAILGG